jgi:nitrate reductase NapAB chaperone NapD
MPISGLLITTEAPADDLLLNTLRQIPGVELGEPIGCKLPLVTEAPSLHAARQRTEQLSQLPGVTQVDVVCVDFEDEVY